jgi:DsbC/DsbD-like thiol-disulfide interchange protein
MHSGTRCSRVILLGTLILSASLISAQAAKPQHSHLSLLSDSASLRPGTSPVIGLRFQLDPGWHIYWKNPGDSGEPPKVAWKLPDGIKSGELQFPIPHRIQDHGLTDFGYEGEVVLLTTLTVPQGFTSNQAQIGADVRYLICREVCIPAKDTISLNLPDAQNPDLIREAKSRLPQPLPAGIQASALVDSDNVTLRIAGTSSILRSVTDFLPAEPQIVENSAKPAMQVSPGNVRIKLKKSEQMVQPIAELRGLLIAGDKGYIVQAKAVAVNLKKSSAVKH